MKKQEKAEAWCAEFGHQPVEAFGIRYCNKCDKHLPERPAEPQTAPDPPKPPEGKERARETLRSHPARSAGRRKCRHSNKEIAYDILKRDGSIAAYDAVYEVRCPFCGATRRNTRLAATIWELRHKHGLSIRTETADGMLARYVLEEPA